MAFSSGFVLAEPFLERRLHSSFGERRYVLHRLSAIGYTKAALVVVTDLWSLPDRELTESVTNDLERHFFLRCEPAARPRHLREQLAQIEATLPAARAAKPQKGRGLTPIMDLSLIGF